MEPRSPALQADSLPAEPQGSPGSRLGAANSNTLKKKTGHDEFSPVRRILQEKLVSESGFWSVSVRQSIQQPRIGFLLSFPLYTHSRERNTHKKIFSENVMRNEKLDKSGDSKNKTALNISKMYTGSTI